MKTALILAATLGACSLKQLSIQTTAKLIEEGGSAMEREPDLEVARAAIPGQIKTLEGLLVAAPTDRRLLALAARGCLEYAFAFLADDVEALTAAGASPEERRAATARATAMYDRAFDYAVRLLETYQPGVRAALARGGSELDAVLARLPAASLPGLTFGGMALASAVELSQLDPARLADLPRARALLARSCGLDPTYHDGSAAMALGVISARLGDRAGAVRYFGIAIAASEGRYLLPRVMKARILDGGHPEALEAVLAEPRDLLPRARLANEVARRRAARYLAAARSPVH
jgi:hypothetical protein